MKLKIWLSIGYNYRYIFLTSRISQWLDHIWNGCYQEGNWTIWKTKERQKEHGNTAPGKIKEGNTSENFSTVKAEP